jgi:hypothetical protein
MKFGSSAPHVTRNTKDFKTAALPVYTPDEFLDKVIKVN